MERQVLRRGAQFGPYVIVTRLGSGAMAEVYLAEEPSGRRVALKVVHRPSAAGESTVARFEREARSVATLSHRNIVAVYDVGAFYATPFIAMEYVEGGSLRTRMAEGPLPLDVVLELAIQLADGLASAHDAGIVHRDLKPDNVMLTRDDEIKILDFGLSKPICGAEAEAEADDDGDDPLAELTLPGTILGTLEYMSPEQARGRRAEFAADQFALGAVLYEMATGVVAFQQDTMARTLAAVTDGAPNPSEKFETLPVGLRRVIERALAKSPEARFSSMRAMADALRNSEATSRPPRSRLAAFGATVTAAFLAVL